MNKTASVPGNSFLSNDIIKHIIDTQDTTIIDDSWKHVDNFVNKDDGTIGRFGYQKTNDDAINFPKIYMVEVHVYQKIDNNMQYRALIVVVPVNEKTRTPVIDDAVVLVKDGKRINVGSDIFNAPFRVDDNEVIQFGWTTFDDAIQARNDELVAQGKFTQDEIDDMIKNDGYVHAHKYIPRLKRT